jgi:hypothetical protein
MPPKTIERDPNQITIKTVGDKSEIVPYPFGVKNPELVLKAPEAKPVKVPEPTEVTKTETPVKEVESVNAQGPEAITGREPSERNLTGAETPAAKAAQEIKKDPSVGEKLLQLAKDTGRTVIELIQGFAKGASGSDIPLASQVRQAEKQIKAEQEAQAIRQKADQDFQMRLLQIQQDYFDRKFAATTAAEKQAAELKAQQDAEEARKNRASAEKIAGARQATTREGGLSGAMQDVVKALGGG